MKRPSKRTLARIYDATNSMRKTAVHFNTTLYYIRKWLLADGTIKPIKQYLPKPNKGSFYKVLQTVATVSDVARYYGVSRPTINRWMRFYGFIQ